MKPSIVLRLIVSAVIVVAFVIGATVAEANNSLNLTSLWWAQRQSHLLWIVDGFALLALLPVYAHAVLQTRLTHKSEEMAKLRDQHETQMEDMIQHTEESERINTHQAKSLETLEGTVEALVARLAALEADTKAHQENLEAETRRLAGEAFAALADEVHTNARQMEAVSLAMQYQRAEIKQLRQNVRAVQHPYEISEIARLTPYELAALAGEAPPLMLEETEEEKKRRKEKEKGRNVERGMMNDESESTSSLIPHSSSLSSPSTPSVGFFEPTMNAGTTFVSPTTEFEITPPVFETTADIELHLAESDRDSEQGVLPSENLTGQLDDAPNVGEATPPETAVTPEEYQFLHGAGKVETVSQQEEEAAPESPQTDSAETEPGQDKEPRGLRRWFMRT